MNRPSILGICLTAWLAGCTRAPDPPPASPAATPSTPAEPEPEPEPAAEPAPAAVEPDAKPDPSPVAAGNDGDPCSKAEDCRSGVCEGEGCGDDALGRCMPKKRMCTRDLQVYCGCDGKSFRGSGSCPGDRYAARGACESDPVGLP